MTSLDIHHLQHLARSQKPEDRATLAGSLAELLQQDLTQGEEFLVQDILLRLLKEAEHNLRLSLASYLAHEKKCPKGLTDFLIFECSFDISEPLLKNATYLDEEYLINIGQNFESRQYWRTLAARQEIGSKLANYLIKASNDNAVHMMLLSNPKADLCNLCMADLTEIAINVLEMQDPLLNRPEMTAQLAARLYWYVSETLRVEIQRRFNIEADTLNGAMWYAVNQNTNKRASVRTIPMEMIGLVRKMPPITRNQIVDGMYKQDRAYFACLLARYFSLSPEDVLYRLTAQTNFTLALFCRALNLTTSQFSQIFLAWQKAASVEKVLMDSKDLTDALYIFNHLKASKATEVIKQWQATIPALAEQATVH